MSSWVGTSLFVLVLWQIINSFRAFEKRMERTRCYVSAGTFTRLGLCRLPYDKALVSRVLSISRDERLMSFW
jgi:hypothetical protein